jgi:hypothetical protein
MGTGNKRIVGIATLAEREHSFRRTLYSIYEQVDKIIAVLNYYDSIPRWLADLKKVEYHYGTNILGASGKFLCVDRIPDGVYFSIDDDIVYPKGYIEYLEDGIRRYDCIVTLHGRTYPRPVVSFKESIANYRCLNDVHEDVQVDVGGTGVMAFHVKRFDLAINMFEHPNMTDCYVAKEAYLQGIPITVLKHSWDYLKYIPPVNSIWNLDKEKSKQTEVLKSFLK